MKKAFTLVEILVVIFIIGLLSTILVVNWRNNEKTYLVQRTAQEIAQNIRQAQDMALSGKVYSPETIPFPYYGANFLTSTKNGYIIFGDDNGNKIYQTSSSDLLIENILFESDIEIYSLTYVKNNVRTVSTALNISFSVPDGFTAIYGANTGSPNGGADYAIIKIKKTGTVCPSVLPAKNCKNITITKIGEITIE